MMENEMVRMFMRCVWWNKLII